MPKFNLKRDEKHEVWWRYRYTVEADTLEDAIKQVMLDKNVDTCGKYTLKRKSKVVFNEDMFAKDNEKLYNKYCEETTTYTLSKNLKEEM